MLTNRAVLLFFAIFVAVPSLASAADPAPPSILLNVETSGDLNLFIKTQSTLLTQPEFLTKILSLKEIRASKWFAAQADPQKALAAGLGVKHIEHTSLFRVHLEIAPADEARMILRLVVAAHLEGFQANLDRQRENDLKLSREHLTAAEKSLDQASRAAEDQRAAIDLAGTRKTLDVAISRQGALESDITRLTVDRTLAQKAFETVQAEHKNPDFKLPAEYEMLVEKSPVIGELTQKRASLVTARDAKLKTLDPQNPEVQALNDKIIAASDELKTARAAEETKAKERRLQSYSDAAKAMDARLDKSKNMLDETNAQIRKLDASLAPIAATEAAVAKARDDYKAAQAELTKQDGELRSKQPRITPAD